MTLPKTHPLYGVLQTLARADYEQMKAQQHPGSWGPWEKLIEPVKWLWMKPHAATFRTIESAGYRVVGPEPTEAMMEAALRKNVFEAVRDAIAAAPTITETEKGG